MRKKGFILFVFMACLSFILFVGGIYAYVSEELSVTNHVDTGVVDIELAEYQLDENGELEPWEDNPIIMPGDRISKIPRITNVGYDCYVRAKLTMSLEELSDAYYEFGEDWIKGNDGYYYYTEVLENGDFTDIFQGIQVPLDFSQEHEDEKITLQIDVDSIQSKNFTPDFEGESPWGLIEIQECIHEGPYSINQVAVAKPNKMGIVYEGSSKELVKNSEDFFMNFTTLMPGDTFTDQVELKNNHKNAMKLFFRTESENTELLSQIQLKLTLVSGSKETVVYEGPLASEALTDKILLTQLSPKETEYLKFSIYMPEKLDNEYTLLSDDVKWFFSTEEIIETGVDTGDSNRIGLYVAAMGLALGICFVVVLLRWRRKEEKR